MVQSFQNAKLGGRGGGVAQLTSLIMRLRLLIMRLSFEKQSGSFTCPLYMVVELKRQPLHHRLSYQSATVRLHELLFEPGVSGKTHRERRHATHPRAGIRTSHLLQLTLWLV